MITVNTKLLDGAGMCGRFISMTDLFLELLIHLCNSSEEYFSLSLSLSLCLFVFQQARTNCFREAGSLQTEVQEQLSANALFTFGYGSFLPTPLPQTSQPCLFLEAISASEKAGRWALAGALLQEAPEESGLTVHPSQTRPRH